MNVAQLFVEMLLAANVRRVFGIVGDSLNGLTEALRADGTIEWVGVRHEETAAFAAGADAAVTGSLAVCAGSCGPGNTHLINGLYDCHRSRVPVLAIAAQIPSNEIGRGYFQETHPERLFQECSHFCELVTDASQLPGVLQTAIRAAVGQGGVAVIVIPGDVFMQDMPKDTQLSPALLPPAPVMRPADPDLDQLADLLNAGRNITLLCGRGCAGVHAPLMRLAEILKSPIVHALGGKEHVEYDNPYDVGMTGLIGFSSGYHAMMACDTLLMLGTDFPYRQFYPQDAKIAQVDHPRGEPRPPLQARPRAGRRRRPPRSRRCCQGCAPRPTAAHLDDSLTRTTSRRATGWTTLATGQPGRKPIHPQFLARKISELATADDACSPSTSAPQPYGPRAI